LVEKPSQRLHWERRGNTDKLILSVAPFGSETEGGYVVLNQPNFSSSSPNSYKPNDGKRNLSLREFLTIHAPDDLKRLKFGERPDGRKRDPDSFVLKVPSVLEIALPAEAVKDQRTPHFYAEASLDATHGKLPVVRIGVSNQKRNADRPDEGVVLVAPDPAAAK